MKAIETYYNGYKFRSRLEARWAVFFDEIGFQYEYEPEGFKLHDGTLYLPDFYLPKYHLYVEVKPERQDMLDSYREKCEKFQDECNDPIMLCYGDPATSCYRTIFGFRVDEEDLDGGLCDWDATFYSNNSGETEIVVRGCLDSFCDGHMMPIDSVINNGKIFELAQDQLFDLAFGAETNCAWVKAAIKARQARFEHGEYG